MKTDMSSGERYGPYCCLFMATVCVYIILYAANDTFSGAFGGFMLSFWLGEFVSLRRQVREWVKERQDWARVTPRERSA